MRWLQMQSPGIKRSFHTLDALRGAAAAAVVTVHYKDLFTPVRSEFGYLAVDLFFIMSGAVLAHAYDGRLASGMTTRRFLAVRVVRLYPLYALSLAIAVATALVSMSGRGAIGWTPPTLAGSVAAALAFLPGPFLVGHKDLFPLNLPTWSLFFELLVNALFALTSSISTPRRVGLVIVSCVPVLAIAGWTAGTLDFGAKASLPDVVLGAVRTIFGFASGVAIARIPLSGRVLHSTPASVGLVASTVICLMVPLAGETARLWPLLCVLVFFPALVYAAMHVEPPRWMVPAATVLGASSYALYVVHVPVLQMFKAVSDRLAPGWLAGAAPGSGMVALIALVVLSWALNRAYDVPMRRGLRRRFGL